jgi:hypothetical protein
VTVGQQNATSLDLKLAHVTPSTPPFELVMGQSINAGWTATVNGHGLGVPVLVDGFANGWRVDPGKLGPAGAGGSLTVLLRWAPQRRVNVALIVSAAALVLCLALVLLPVRRRRWSPPDPMPADPIDPGPSVSQFSADTPDLREGPWSAGGPRRSPESPSVAFAVVVGVLVGVVAFAIAAPLTGMFVGAATGFAVRNPRLRWLMGLAAALLVFVAGVVIVAWQGSSPFAANGGWPAEFGVASGLVWAG